MNVWDFGKLLVSSGILTQEQVNRAKTVEIIADTKKPEGVRLYVEMYAEDGSLTTLVQSLGGEP